VTRRRVLAALVATLLLAPAVLGMTAATAAPSVGVVGPVRVAVTSVNPPSPGPGDTFVVGGRAVNAGTLPIADVGVRLLIDHAALTSRDALQQAASVDMSEDPQAADTGGEVVKTSIISDLSPSLGPGQSVPFSISIPADSLGLGLTAFGVHTLTVEARGIGVTGERVTLGAVRTFLVWRGSGGLPTLRTTWLVPLQDRPLRGVDGRYDPKAASDLAESFQAGGRLGSLVAAGTGRPITWALDPDLLEEASDLSVGAPTADGRTTTPDEGASEWITELRAAKEVRALPYADPDLTAQRRASLSGELGAQVSSGVASATGLLGRPIAPAPAWPVDAATTMGTVAGASAAGLEQVVLSSAAVRTPDAGTATPDALGVLSGTSVQAVTSDAALSALASTDPGLLGNPTLARLRFMAETAMIAAERPSDPRSVVIALPRNWAPTPAWAHRILTVDRVAPWIVPTDLADLTADPGDGPERRLAIYPSAALAGEVASGQLRVVRQTTTRLRRFAEILTEPAAYVPAYEKALQRAQSAAWREEPAAGQLFAASTAASLADQVRKVRILPRGQVTLSSRTGKVPLSVHNGLDQDVQVRVDLTATPAFRLRMGQQSTSTVPAGRTISVEVPASTSADGRIPVQARLSTPSGEAFGVPVTFQMRATGYGAVARLVAGGLVFLLAIALVVRVVRRIRAGAPDADAARDTIAEEAGQR
jgi:hypothetical protein